MHDARALRDDANCSKIAYSVLELYTEICELRKTVGNGSGWKLNYDLNANGEEIDLACSRRHCAFQDWRIRAAPTREAR